MANDIDELEQQEIHTCSICNKTEQCKGESCEFINKLGFHASCYAKSKGVKM